VRQTIYGGPIMGAKIRTRATLMPSAAHAIRRLAELLLGAVPGTPAGMTVSRVAGVALLALGVAC